MKIFELNENKNTTHGNAAVTQGQIYYGNRIIQLHCKHVLQEQHDSPKLLSFQTLKHLIFLLKLNEVQLTSVNS